MALDELRNAKQLTQADLAELLNVPQSSISRIEQRTDMYLLTLRNYVQATGGVLQIQAVFPVGGAIVINRFGDYEDQPYIVVVQTEKKGAFQLQAGPFHNQGSTLSLLDLTDCVNISCVTGLACQPGTTPRKPSRSS